MKAKCIWETKALCEGKVIYLHSFPKRSWFFPLVQKLETSHQKASSTSTQKPSWCDIRFACFSFPVNLLFKLHCILQWRHLPAFVKQFLFFFSKLLWFQKYRDECMMAAMSSACMAASFYLHSNWGIPPQFNKLCNRQRRKPIFSCQRECCFPESNGMNIPAVNVRESSFCTFKNQGRTSKGQITHTQAYAHIHRRIFKVDKHRGFLSCRWLNVKHTHTHTHTHNKLQSQIMFQFLTIFNWLLTKRKRTQEQSLGCAEFLEESFCQCAASSQVPNRSRLGCHFYSMIRARLNKVSCDM